MKNLSCCFTGHREIPDEEYLEVQDRLDCEIMKLVDLGVTRFYAGCALGFDTMAALAVLKLKQVFPSIILCLVLPFKDQSKSWNKADKKVYDIIYELSD